MRKFFAGFAATIFLTTNASLVVACDPKEYTDFMKYIDEKQTFVFYISAWDCNKCQQTTMDLWNPLTDDDNTGLKKMISNIDRNSGLSVDTLKSINSLHVYKYRLDKVASAFDDDAIKKIVDYLIKQFESKLDRKYMTKSDIKISGLPLFLYFDKGKFEGYIQHEFVKPTTSGTLSAQQYFEQSVINIIGKHGFTWWKPNPWPF